MAILHSVVDFGNLDTSLRRVVMIRPTHFVPKIVNDLDNLWTGCMNSICRNRQNKQILDITWEGELEDLSKISFDELTLVVPVLDLSQEFITSHNENNIKPTSDQFRRNQSFVIETIVNRIIFSMKIDFGYLRVIYVLLSDRDLRPPLFNLLQKNVLSIVPYKVLWYHIPIKS